MGIVDAIRDLRQREEEIVKLVETGNYGSTVREIDFPTAAAIYGDVGTWCVSNLAHTTARETTHRWRDVAVRAGSTNLGSIEANAPTERQVYPVQRTNTCMIRDARISVSGSASKEAENGIYGDDLANQVQFQISVEMKGLLKDIEQQILFGTLNTGQPRRFKGLAGDVGTWNGFLSTNVYDMNTNHGTTAITAAFVNQFLRSIYDQDTGFFPDTLLVSSKTVIKFAGFANVSNFTYTPADINSGAVSKSKFVEV